MVGFLEDQAQRLGALLVGEVAPLAEDALDLPRMAVALALHRDVVVKLQGQQIAVCQGFGMLDGEVTHIGGVADANRLRISYPNFDYKSVGCGRVMGKLKRSNLDSFDGLKIRIVIVIDVACVVHLAKSRIRAKLGQVATMGPELDMVVFQDTQRGRHVVVAVGVREKRGCKPMG